MSQSIEIYVLKQQITFILSDNNSLENYYMHRQSVKIYKGANTNVEISIKNADAKKVNASGRQLFCYIVSQENNETVISKSVDIIDDSIGKFVLYISRGEVELLDDGFYRMTLTYRDEFDNEHYLYGDSSYNPVIEVEVLSNAQSTFVPSLESDASKWHCPGYNFYPQDLTYYSQGYPGALQKGMLSSVQTVAFYLENFSGDLRIQACMENAIPSNNGDWFDIQLQLLSPELHVTNMTGLEPFSFQIACQWVRFLYKADLGNSGYVKKVLYRY